MTRHSAVLLILILLFGASVSVGTAADSVNKADDPIQLAEQLKSPDPKARIRAAERLRAMGKKASPVIDDMIPAWDDPERRVGMHISWALRSNAHAAFPKLLDMLVRGDREDLATGIIMSLGRAGAADTARALDKVEFRVQLILLDIILRRTAWNFGNPEDYAEAEPALIRMIEEFPEDEKWRPALVTAEINPSNERAVAVILDALVSHKDKGVRSRLANDIGDLKINPNKAVPPLIGALRDSPPVANKAAYSLERIGTDEARRAAADFCQRNKLMYLATCILLALIMILAGVVLIKSFIGGNFAVRITLCPVIIIYLVYAYLLVVVHLFYIVESRGRYGALHFIDRIFNGPLYFAIGILGYFPAIIQMTCLMWLLLLAHKWWRGARFSVGNYILGGVALVGIGIMLFFQWFFGGFFVPNLEYLFPRH